MLKVLISEIPKGAEFSVTTSSATPIPRPPWVPAGFGWIAADMDDRVIFLSPGRPLIASGAAGLISKLTQKGFILNNDDE